MQAIHGIPTNYFQTYHNDHSLLFMFILSDFIETAETLNAIHIMCGRGSPVVEGQQVTADEERSSTETIQKLLWLLVGSSHHAPRHFNWQASEGFLPKLRNYCFLFQQKVDGTEKDGLTIQHYAEKIMGECLQAIDTLHQEDRTTFLKAIDKADSSLQRLAKVLARQITHFRDDENVIFFVAKNREKLDKIYGNRFVAKLLHKMYPKGLREAHNFLVKKYQERGFDQMLPEIAKRMGELEASF